MLSGDFDPPQAKLSQHRKDIRLILQAVVERDLPLSRLHDALLGEAESRGWGELDNSAVYRLYEDD